MRVSDVCKGLALGLILSVISMMSGCSAAAHDRINQTASEDARLFAQTPAPDSIVDALARHAVPGLAIAQLRGCDVSGSQAYGLADLEPARLVGAMTVFEAASLSKPVFGYLVMGLVEEGVIELDQPFAQEFDYPRIADKQAYAMLTPRLVLSHQTGLPNWVGNTAYYDRSDPIDFVAEPMGDFTYSGEAYQLLKAYIEFKTGRSLGALFFEKLGDVMPQSTFVAPFPAGVDAARGFTETDNPQSGRDINLHDDTYAAGSLVTTAEDYAAFLSHVCHRRGLSEASYDEMLRPHTSVPINDENITASYGLGWAILTTQTQTLYYHSGDNRHFQSAAAFDAQTGDGVVYLTNGAAGEALIDDLIGW